MTLCLAVGTSPIWGFTVTDPDATSTPVNIAGATFEMLVKESVSDLDADAVYELTSADDEIVILSAAAGTAQILNDATKTALLVVGTPYYWSLRITFSTGENRVIRKGFLSAEPA